MIGKGQEKKTFSNPRTIKAVETCHGETCGGFENFNVQHKSRAMAGSCDEYLDVSATTLLQVSNSDQNSRCFDSIKTPLFYFAH